MLTCGANVASDRSRLLGVFGLHQPNIMLNTLKALRDVCVARTVQVKRFHLNFLASPASDRHPDPAHLARAAPPLARCAD